MGTKYIEHPLIKSGSVEVRLYQEVIAYVGHEKNTLVVLPTALGKTVISILTSVYFLQNYPDMQILIMAPTRPLVSQHRDSFLSFLNVSPEDVASLTGESDARKRETLWKKGAKLLFATPEVVRNDLEANRISLNNFSLLVFDEAHRARKNYAYTFIAKKYIEQGRWPIILAMTASPGGNQEMIHEICEMLSIEQVEYRSEEDADVAPYIHQVKVDWKTISLPEEYKEMGGLLKSMLYKRLNMLQRMGLLKRKLEYVSRRDLLQIGDKLGKLVADKELPTENKGTIFAALIFNSAALSLFHALELLETQGITSLRDFLERMEERSSERKGLKNIINDPKFMELKVLSIKYKDIEHPKVSLMREEVLKQIQASPNSRVLVFTQYRNTAQHLVNVLGKVNGIRVKRFVGQASKESDRGLTQEEQAGILKDYREGKLNVLISTCIGEEGLDLPNVDLVIFYEPVPSEIRYIQRKGRTGRKSIGRVTILGALESADIAYFYAAKRRVEKMRRIIAQLNKKLKQIERKGERPKITPGLAIPEIKTKIEVSPAEEILIIPEPEPVTPEIKIQTQVAPVEPKAVTETHVKPLRELEVASLKGISKVTRFVWDKAIATEKAGILIEDLIAEAEEIGYSPSLVKVAIFQLVNSGALYQPSWDRIMATGYPIQTRQLSAKDQEVHEVMVEKIYPGKAVVWIDRKWRARITPEQFTAPLSYLKKGSRFKIRGKLYHEGDVLCVDVFEVLGAPKF